MNNSLNYMLNHKRNLLVITTIITALFGSVSHAYVSYFLDDIKVSEEDYNNIDFSLIDNSYAIRDEDSGNIMYSLKSSVFARIDTISEPGHVLLVRKPQDEIDRIRKVLSSKRRDNAVCKPGDTLPDLKVVRHTELEDTISIKSLANGKVVVIHFWLTAGQDCIGLSAPQLPAILAPYAGHSNFTFISVNVNPHEIQLKNFLNSEEFLEYGWLKDVTLFDRKGCQGLHLSNKTHPLTIVVDQYGIIRYNEIGDFSYKEDSKALSELLSSLLD